MSSAAWVLTLIAFLFAVRWAAQLWLERLNQHHVAAHADAVPRAFRDSIDPSAYARSIQYTLAKSRLSQVEDTCDTVVVLAVLFSGVLPRACELFAGRLGSSAWSMGVFVFAVGLALVLPRLSLGWYEQFQLEERFGFNTSTARLWWTDRLKSLVIVALLGYPLLVLILTLVEWTGDWWWLWAWVCILAFEFLMALLAPVLILPLFNKFSPLPEGSLRERLLALAERAGFRTKDIQVMDGSKRSRHSNAFFTGFGHFRKVALFDTLIQQLSEPELEAVLAHEIGHYRKKHVVKMLAWSAITLLLGLSVAAWLAKQVWFYRAFGFEPGNLAPALLLVALLSGIVTYWLSPLHNFWSRRYEFEADAFAATTMREPQSLITALRKLNEKNLSNLMPHPLYSGFYYSHPTLLEREGALAGIRIHAGE